MAYPRPRFDIADIVIRQLGPRLANDTVLTGHYTLEIAREQIFTIDWPAIII
jgi:hypothetical protein